MKYSPILTPYLGIIVGILILLFWQGHETIIDFLIVMIVGYYLVIISFLNIVKNFILGLTKKKKKKSIINKLWSIFLVLAIVTPLMILTTVIPNSVEVQYSGILGCELGCTVVASGYPFPFIADYPGLSPADTADFLGALDGSDKIIWANFITSFLFWLVLCFSILVLLKKYKKT